MSKSRSTVQAFINIHSLTTTGKESETHKAGGCSEGPEAQKHRDGGGGPPYVWGAGGTASV